MLTQRHSFCKSLTTQFIAISVMASTFVSVPSIASASAHLSAPEPVSAPEPEPVSASKPLATKKTSTDKKVQVEAIKKVESIEKGKSNFAAARNHDINGNHVAPSIRDTIGKYLDDAQSLQDIAQYQEAKSVFQKAKTKAQESHEIGLYIWVEQKRIENLILNNDLFLANQAYQSLIQVLEDADLQLVAEQQKMKWSKLKIRQLQFWQADQLLEQVYQYANARKNRELQLKAVLILTISQHKQLKFDYARQLLDGAEKLSKLPRAFGRNKQTQRQLELEYEIIKAQQALYEIDVTAIEQRPTVPELLNQADKKLALNSNAILLQQPIALELMDVNTKIALLSSDWATYYRLQNRLVEQGRQPLLEIIERINQARHSERENAKLLQTKQKQQHASATNELNQVIDLLNNQLNHARWLILLLVLIIVFSIYNAVLRRQKLINDGPNYLTLHHVEKRYQNKLSAGAKMHIMDVKITNVDDFNLNVGITATDKLLQRLEQKLNNLANDIEVIPVSAGQFYIFADQYSQQQITIFTKRIEAEVAMVNPKLIVRFANEECSNGQPFPEILTQLKQKV